ncbi:phosphate ABC transporter substrate-binding protein [Clostridium botulinum]|uniref:phosphate ABC transporter substrate-binding protein n=2 Tax=Clostridium botulinum TaxID=1491 RepID=UPI0004D5DAE8|nr:phosphate ABC transporter substrate-binding protein [Clostridium botulinum]KEH97738.1 phosphate ABC transporter substrate-binding protein [Clostridium botulinum D str. 16868]KOA77465.1 phosphate ABC transporter substrate-binding protein [Clostridium botulinum]KOA93229.1 phosphate ABC transporter substrate-binding protein [Clostridium botulinum]MCD3201623.1 phosphate ABC transporter substrate-binding protein [Clostridium botulinum C/D]MCD3222533.1 phosphate ABC transporter substrate-binding 
MKKKSLKHIMIFSIISAIAVIATSCSKGNHKFITISGSSVLQPIVKSAADIFMEKNPESQINVQGGGSGTGLSQVVSGAVEIGNSDLSAVDKINDKNILNELVDHKIAVSGFVMVVNDEVKIKSLTKKQIQDIFTGKIINWKEVGGEDVNIEVINRGKSSGSRATFIKTIMDGKLENLQIGTIQDSSGAVQKSIKETKGAISYLATSYFKSEEAKKGLNILKINNIDGNTKNIIERKYPFWSYEHMYTKGNPSGTIKKFIDYMYSPEVKKIIEDNGYIPIDKMK